MNLTSLRRVLREHADRDDAIFLQRYFKTGPGEYGEGDRFLGIRLPVLRRLAKQNRSLDLNRIQSLLHSRWHEERMLALLLLVEKNKRATGEERGTIRDLYLANTRHINNWDLVDCSSHYIVGPFVVAVNDKTLQQLARSENLWERRIAIMATLDCIRRDWFEPTLKIADELRNDPHDLIHKAVGWMLREVGNRDRQVAEAFLRPRYKTLPRTLLRYAIEKYPERLRRRYLRGTL